MLSNNLAEATVVNAPELAKASVQFVPSGIRSAANSDSVANEKVMQRRLRRQRRQSRSMNRSNAGWSVGLW